MSLLAAVEGGDGEVDVVRLGVVTNGVTVGNEGPETHHAVRVRRHLEGTRDRRTRLFNLYRRNVRGWKQSLSLIENGICNKNHMRTSQMLFNMCPIGVTSDKNENLIQTNCSNFQPLKAFCVLNRSKLNIFELRTNILTFSQLNKWPVSRIINNETKC